MIMVPLKLSILNINPYKKYLKYDDYAIFHGNHCYENNLSL